MIDYALVSYPIMGGLDTKATPSALQAPQLQVALDCWVDRTGELRKRYGYQVSGGDVDLLDIAGSTISTGISLAPHGDTHLLFTDRYAYAYVASADRYTGLGGVMSARLSVRGIAAASDANIYGVDHATTGNYTVYAQLEYNAAGSASQVRWILIDNATGGIVAADTEASATCVRAASRGSYLYVLYGEGTNIKTKILNCTSTAALMTSIAAAVVTTATDYGGTTAANLDVASNATYGVFVAYRSTTATTIKWGFVSTAGALGSTSTAATTGNAALVAVSVATGDAMHGVCYSRQTGADIYALARSWSGAAWTATATSAAIEAAPLASDAQTLACAWETNATTLTIWYSGDYQTSGASGSTDDTYRIYQSSYTTAGVATARSFTVYKAHLASKPFIYGGTWYALALCGASTQPTLALVNLDGVGSSPEPQSGAPIAIFTNNGASGAMLGSVTAPSATSFRVGFIQRRVAMDNEAPAQLPVGSVATIELQAYDRHRAVQLGDSTYIGGGVLLQFDGLQLVEAGFLRYVEPDRINDTPSNGAGSLTASTTYSYIVVPEWTNASGIREQGTHAGAKTVTMGVGEDTVALAIPSIALTLKGQSIVFAIYRTEANGSTFYRIGHVANDPTAIEATYTDLVADSTIVDNEPYYAQDEAVLDNTPTPNGHVIAKAAGRVFVASPSVRGLIYASKLREADEPLSFNDALTIQLPDDGSDITALAEMGGALVAFTERGVYRIAGEGPANATANGSVVGGWLTPESLSVDTGATCQRSVVTTPMGIMFRGTKGIMLLDQSYQLQYIGSPLENLSTGAPAEQISGILVPARQQVRFSDATYSYIYDYYHRQWYVWSFAADGPDVVVGGSHVVPKGASVYTETADTYADDGVAYTMTARLALFRDPSSLQGEIRVRRVGVVGSVVAQPVTLTVQTAHDYSDTVIQTLTSTLTATGPFREKWRAATKIVSALQLTITDGGTSGAGFKLHEIAVEIGQRQAGKSMSR